MTQKQHKAGVFAALLFCLSASTAEAKDLAGSFGVGGTASLAGATGISGTYFLSDSFGLSGVFSFGLRDEDGPGSAKEFQIGASALYSLWSAENIMLDAVGTFAIGFQDTGNSGTEIGFGGGIRPEFFPTPYLSFFVEAGLVIKIIPDTGEVLDDNIPGPGLMEGTLVGIATGVAGNAGFNFWF